MAIERTDLTETDEQREARIQAEREKQEALEAKLRSEEIARAKAEAALEESRRGRETNSIPTVTEEQWQQMENETGKTRQQIQADAKLQAALVENMTKPLKEELRQTREEAARAKAEAAEIKSRQKLEKVETEFYKKNSALSTHKDLVDEFLNEFPDKDKIDQKTYEKRLSMAAEYVKGKVKDIRTERKATMEKEEGTFRSGRIERQEEETDTNTGVNDEEFDPTGTGSESAAYLVGRIHKNLGKDVKPETVRVWKESLDAEGKGVQISSREDVARTEAMLSRGGTLKP